MLDVSDEKVQAYAWNGFNGYGSCSWVCGMKLCFTLTLLGLKIAWHSLTDKIIVRFSSVWSLQNGNMVKWLDFLESDHHNDSVWRHFQSEISQIFIEILIDINWIYKPAILLLWLKDISGPRHTRFGILFHHTWENKALFYVYVIKTKWQHIFLLNLCLYSPKNSSNWFLSIFIVCVHFLLWN